MAILTTLSAAAESPTPKGMDRIECLRTILVARQRREVSYREAEDIGGSLIDFFQTLGAVNQGEEIWVS